MYVPSIWTHLGPVSNCRCPLWWRCCCPDFRGLLTCNYSTISTMDIEVSSFQNCSTTYTCIIQIETMHTSCVFVVWPFLLATASPSSYSLMYCWSVRLARADSTLSIPASCNSWVRTVSSLISADALIKDEIEGEEREEKQRGEGTEMGRGERMREEQIKDHIGTIMIQWRWKAQNILLQFSPEICFK